MSKKRRVEATAEEQEIMKRAEAKAAAIDNKPTVVEEETTVVKPRDTTPGVTIVNAEEQQKKRPVEDVDNSIQYSKQQIEDLSSGKRKQDPYYKSTEEEIQSWNDYTNILNEEKKNYYGTSYTADQVANSEALQKLLNDDNANIASNAILSEGTKNAESLEDLEKVKQDAEAAKDLEEIEKNKLQSEIYSGPGASNVNLAPNATSTYLQGIGNQQGKPSYVDGVATKDKVEKDIVNTYAAMDSQVPQAVVERLGVQDYYPQVGRDVAVGTFTGSRIGSQTIYSGAGALLPMGLYDARKRALAQAAKDKQAAVDKYFDLIETAPQYQEKFNVDLMDWMNDSLYNKHKGNADAFIKDPTVRREYARRKGLAKELTHYSKWSDDLLKDASDEKKYVTKDMIETAAQIKSALIDNTDDVVSGKKDLGPLFAKAQVYQNIIPQVDIMVKEALSESALGRSPINLRTGGVYDSEKFKNEANQFIQKTKTGDINRNDFITGFKKYFTGDYEQAINGLIGSGKYSDEQTQAAIDYFAGQMQEQVILDHKILDSKALDWANLAEKKRQFNLNYQKLREEGQTHWQARNKEMNFVDATTGKPMAEIIGDLKRRGITGDQLNRKILEVARRNGIENATIDPYTNSVVIKELASSYENSKPKGVNNSSVWVNLKEKVVKNGKPTWKYLTVKATDLPDLDLNKRKISFQDDTPLTKDVQTQYRTAIKNNKLSMRTNSYDLAYGYADAKKNDIVTVNPENISGYDPKKMVFVKKSVGRISTAENQKDGTVKYISLPGTIYVKSEFSSSAGINSNDEIWGQGIKSEPGFGLGQGAVVETATYSSSSGEE